VRTGIMCLHFSYPNLRGPTLPVPVTPFAPGLGASSKFRVLRCIPSQVCFELLTRTSWLQATRRQCFPKSLALLTVWVQHALTY
jgi:hypothetical protein